MFTCAGLMLACMLVTGCYRRATDDWDPKQFSNWPTMTEKPVSVPLQMALSCVAPPQDHGPHGDYTITVRVSPNAAEQYRRGEPMPVGAVVVKEKFLDTPQRGTPQGYAKMEKREPRYFPAGGDWECSYVALGSNGSAQSGPLDSCPDCHQHVAAFQLPSSAGIVA